MFEINLVVINTLDQYLSDLRLLLGVASLGTKNKVYPGYLPFQNLVCMKMF